MTQDTEHKLRELSDELLGLLLLANATTEILELERLQHLFTSRLFEAKRLGYRARFAPGPHETVRIEWDNLPRLEKFL